MHCTYFELSSSYMIWEFWTVTTNLVHGFI